MKTEFEKFVKSLMFLINQINSLEDDLLKMRYLLNFYEKIYRKNYIISLGKEIIIKIMVAKSKYIKNERDLQIYWLMIYFLSFKDKKFLPKKIDKPLVYDFYGINLDQNLVERNFLISDNCFNE